ncbi:MAG: hypothetical protein LAO03_14410 [Acidobacteriia bacterium]|nr:hypothetical protein [Terriglobia bacterium]
MAKRISLLGLCFLWVLALPAGARSQAAGPEAAYAFPAQTVHPPPDAVKPLPPPGEEERDRMKKDMEKRANQQRQADLERDTEKLLQLATELKHYVDKSNKNVLSLEVIRKSEEIEKLAHSVREKMRGSN